MTDKERILMVIISRIIPGLAYSYSMEKRNEYIDSCMLSPEKLNRGDLVFANTTMFPNEFMVGFVDNIETTHVVIREIGSQRLCNYSNESFTKINKDKLGYEILEGVQYQIYQKVLKAFSKYARYSIRFKSISFENNVCSVMGRRMFDSETAFSIFFPYSGKTSIKEIGRRIVEAEPDINKYS
ncbi:hypothetical protein SDC9_82499 [bioreactor metagenome]|uniref:Uncharacterized protein n=1 Tax=bioreactor metagenome TaxID=1076179 RepID=A0A644Z4R5_9ZZZZ